MTKAELLAKAADDRRTYVWHVETAPRPESGRRLSGRI